MRARLAPAFALFAAAVANCAAYHKHVLNADANVTRRNLPRCGTIARILAASLEILGSESELLTLEQALYPLCPTGENEDAAQMYSQFRANASALTALRGAVAFRDSRGEYTLAPCARKRRLGPDGEGGKVMCDDGGLNASEGGCLVLSVGSNGQVEFEAAIHGLLPNCGIDVWDGTLTGARRCDRTFGARVPAAPPSLAHTNPRAPQPLQAPAARPARVRPLRAGELQQPDVAALRPDALGGAC